MLKSEFETITGTEVTDAEYEKIEFVYMHHPAIKDKHQIAGIWQNGGMAVIKDMAPTAKKGEQFTERLRAIRSEEQRIKEELERLALGEDEGTWPIAF